MGGETRLFYCHDLSGEPEECRIRLFVQKSMDLSTTENEGISSKRNFRTLRHDEGVSKKNPASLG